MRIQNNIMAMNTHRMYTVNNSAVQRSAEKLSSGYRVNRAGDDAAGLAISEKMRAQIRGLNMASKNSQDAVSLVQTAEGALQEVHSMLQRMNELAVQSASGTNDTGVDRAALQQEFQNLQDEIDQIAETTTFNDMKIMDGTYGNPNKVQNNTDPGQVPALAESVPEELDITPTSVTAGKAAEAGTAVYDLSALATGQSVTAAGITVTNTDGTFSSAGDAPSGYTAELSETGVLTFTQTAGDEGTVEAVTFADVTGGSATGLAATVSATTNNGSAAVTAKATFALGDFSDYAVGDTITVGDVTVAIEEGDASWSDVAVTNGTTWKGTIDSSGNLAIEQNTAADLEESAITAMKPSKTAASTEVTPDDNTQTTQPATTTVTGLGDMVEGDSITFNGTEYKLAAAEDAANNEYTSVDDILAAIETDTGWTATQTGSDVTFTAPADDTSTTNPITAVTVGGQDAMDNVTYQAAGGADAEGGLVIQTGAEEGQTLTIYIESMNTAGLKIEKANVDISTQETASKAITATREAINAVSTQRAELGAMQNRLEHKIQNLDNTAENLSAAESRIRDVDMAKEMTEFTKQNILSQAATAMLAQANSAPQGVLSLLQ